MKSNIVEYALTETPGIRALYARNMSQGFARHSHESYVVGVVLSGVRIIITDDKRIVVGAGGVFQLMPYQQHSCEFEGECDYFALSVTRDKYKDICAREQVGITSQDVSQLIMDVFSCSTPKTYGSEFRGCVLNIINFLITQLNPEVEGCEVTHELLSRGLDFINKNYALKLSLDDIAEYSLMSKYNFQRTFTKYYGMSPAALVAKKRVAEAVSRVKSGERPSMVALDCGFSDQSHLCRVVKKVTGVSLRDYDKIDLFTNK